MSDNDQFMQLAEMLEGVKEVVKQHRDVVFRAINLLNHEVLTTNSALKDVTTRLDKDSDERVTRQRDVDKKLELIARWQWLRFGIEIAIVILLLTLILVVLVSLITRRIA